MTRNRSNRAPWSPIVNLVPYYRVKGEYYEDCPNGIYINIKYFLLFIVKYLCWKRILYNNI